MTARRVLTVPNVVSVLRLVLVGVFVWLVAIGEVGVAGIVLGVIGATDWVDGFLARRLGQVTELGKFLDPLADRIAVAVAVVAGLITGVLPAWFAWALIVRELAVAAGALYGMTRGVRRLDVRPLGKLATLLLYFAVTGFYLGAPDGFDLPFLVVAAYVVGVPGLVAYYVVAVRYAFDLRSAIAARGAGASG